MPTDPEPSTLELVTHSRSLPIAFLVDGDNASAGLVGEMLAEAAKFGSVEIRRVYGDWASGKLSSWRPTVQEHALVPVQQFTAVSGKNATDSALIIDAMDILHSGRVRGFCIVSSDSDFTRLATRLRESGMFVVGIGRAQTPPAFRNACNVFVATENLIGSREDSQQPARGKKPSSPVAPSTPVAADASGTRRAATEAFELIDKAFDSVAGEDGYCHLAELGNALLKLDPAFDPRTFGKSKLGDLLEAIPGKYELQRPPPRTSGAVLVRRRPSGRS
ncbi:MAG TPA: NYN domain-containing protein [Thermoplasmata archaeon]|nr:NYN domain-containing protein [Thermoplasmata archaeon]